MARNQRVQRGVPRGALPAGVQDPGEARRFVRGGRGHDQGARVVALDARDPGVRRGAAGQAEEAVAPAAHQLVRRRARAAAADRRGAAHPVVDPEARDRVRGRAGRPRDEDRAAVAPAQLFDDGERPLAGQVCHVRAVRREAQRRGQRPPREDQQGAARDEAPQRARHHDRRGEAQAAEPCVFAPRYFYPHRPLPR